jgi:hypothetical protein
MQYIFFKCKYNEIETVKQTKKLGNASFDT